RRGDHGRGAVRAAPANLRAGREPPPRPEGPARAAGRVGLTPAGPLAVAPAMVLRSEELQMSRGESPRDTALVLSRHVAGGALAPAPRAARAPRHVPATWAPACGVGARGTMPATWAPACGVGARGTMPATWAPACGVGARCEPGSRGARSP